MLSAFIYNLLLTDDDKKQEPNKEEAKGNNSEIKTFVFIGVIIATNNQEFFIKTEEHETVRIILKTNDKPIDFSTYKDKKVVLNCKGTISISKSDTKTNSDQQSSSALESQKTLSINQIISIETKEAEDKKKKDSKDSIGNQLPD